jgi:2,4-didehydro-3-deoxy-L-rhamnonate hydrolase
MPQSVGAAANGSAAMVRVERATGPCRAGTPSKQRVLPCAGGRVARQHGPVARSTQTILDAFPGTCRNLHFGNYFRETLYCLPDHSFMKLIRYGLPGQEKPGIILNDGKRKDCSQHFADWNREFFNAGGLEKLQKLLPLAATFPDVKDEARWAAPIARPGKVIGIGLNYSDHAAESGMPIPAEPIVFLKGTNTVCGPHDPIIIPKNSTKTDWEVELGVVIGRDTKYLASVEAARSAIAGYCISHDVSERHFQLERGGQWTKGKSADNFNPLGPWLATADEIADVRCLNLTLDVNGQRKQTGTTAKMIFDVYFIVHYLSQFMTLEAGDVITTGTPPGVGLGHKPPQFLKAGDLVSMSIDGLGNQRATCVNA